MKTIDQQFTEILMKSPLFKGIVEADIHNMIGCLNPRVNVYKKGDTIAMMGEEFIGIGIVIEGEVIVAKDNVAGNRTIMTLLKTGDMFGEMISFSQQKVWIVNVTAQSNSKVLFISPEKLIDRCEKLCAGHSQLIQNLLLIMSKKAILLNRKVEYLSIKSIRGKLSAYLLEMQKKSGDAFFELHLNRDELADFFNVARPSISRELGKMKQEGLIDFHKSTFKIIDIERLKEFID